MNLSQSPLFTIGIPTFNRPELLRHAIASALHQTYSNIEVIVCDNASGIDVFSATSDIVDDRLRVFRNDRNIGSARNFAGILKFARGEYFSWLQDDDLLRPDFAARAVANLQEHSGKVYVCGAIATASSECLTNSYVYAPPFALDWCNASARTVSFPEILAFSLFTSIAVPPVMAFCRATLEISIHEFLNDAHILFVERTLLAHLASHAVIVADPYVGGIIREHDQQLWRHEARTWADQWKSAAERLNTIASAASGYVFDPVFGGIPTAILAKWNDECAFWPQGNPLCQSVKAIITEELSRRDIPVKSVPGGSPRLATNRSQPLKRFVRQILPPFIFDGLSRLKNCTTTFRNS